MPVNNSAKAAIEQVVPGEKSFAVVYDGKTLAAGDHIPKAQTHTGAPEIVFTAPTSGADKPYLIVMLDMDAPFPSLPIMGPILHWMQPGLKAISGSLTYTQSEPFLVDYMGASPPPGSGPHRYCFFLYEQPTSFDQKKIATKFGSQAGAKVGAGKRIRFDLDAFEKEVGLGKIVACTYVKSN